MTKSFKNLSELANYLQGQINQSLKSDVAPMVKEKMQEHVEKDVYQAYYPTKQYERTGGLKKDIEIREVTEGVEIVPTRTDEDTGKYIPSVVETGQGYSYSGYGYSYEQPRPFVENTRRELMDSGAHVEKLKQGLKAKGLDVK